MKKIVVSAFMLMATVVYAHEGELVEEHSVLQIIVESPVVVAWVAILVILAVLSVVFWFMSRKEEAKVKKKIKNRKKK